MTSLTKGILSFQLFYKCLLLFYEKGFQKTKFKIYITDSFPRYRCMLFFGAFEDRKTLTNRVFFFFPKSVLNCQWCAAGINRRIYHTISGSGCQLAGWLKLPRSHVIIFSAWNWYLLWSYRLVPNVTSFSWSEFNNGALSRA